MFAEQEDRHLPEVAPNKFILVGFGDEPSHSLTEESAERFCRQTGWIGNVRRGGGVGMEADPDLAVEMLARVEMSRFEIGPQRTQQCIITLRLLLQQKVPVIAALDRSIRLEPTGQRCLRGWTIMHRQARRPSQRAFPPWRRRNARSTNRPT